MARTEPLNEDGSLPHPEARTVKLEMEDKMIQIKKRVVKGGFQTELLILIQQITEKRIQER